MGGTISCDVCGNNLSQESDQVHELKDGTPEHVCVECFDETKHKGHTLRSVYSVVGEANAARLNASGAAPVLLQGLGQQFADCVGCECGAQTVKGPDVTACFACGKPFAVEERA